MPGAHEPQTQLDTEEASQEPSTADGDSIALSIEIPRLDSSCHVDPEVLCKYNHSALLISTMHSIGTAYTRMQGSTGPHTTGNPLFLEVPCHLATCERNLQDSLTRAYRKSLSSSVLSICLAKTLRLAMSMSNRFLRPGLCTLTTTASPVCRTALCTCAHQLAQCIRCSSSLCTQPAELPHRQCWWVTAHWASNEQIMKPKLTIVVNLYHLP